MRDIEDLAMRSYNQGVADGLESMAEALEIAHEGVDGVPFHAETLTTVVALIRLAARNGGREPSRIDN